MLRNFELFVAGILVASAPGISQILVATGVPDMQRFSSRKLAVISPAASALRLTVSGIRAASWTVHVEFTSSGTRQEFRQTRGNAESRGDFCYRQR